MTSLDASDVSSSTERPVHPSPISVLHVDDERVFLDLCRIHLGRYDIHVTTAESVTKALPLLESCRFDVILSDYQMPVIDGIGFLKILQKNKSPIPVIIFTGASQDEVRLEAMNNGAASFLHKGGEPRILFAELAHKIQEVSWRCRAEGLLKSPGENSCDMSTCLTASCTPKKEFVPWMSDKQPSSPAGERDSSFSS